MAENFFELSIQDRKMVLDIAVRSSGRPPIFIEKDIWVVWCIQKLFETAIGERLLFKGGTSLAKICLWLIERFSEDVDLVRDMRDLVQELANIEQDWLMLSHAKIKELSRVARTQ